MIDQAQVLKEARTNPPLPRTYDLVVYGATGFVGRRCVEYVYQNAPPRLRWAIAGRNYGQLEYLSSKYQRPMIIAEADDVEGLKSLAAQTRVILSAAGPFSLFSDHLVSACVAHRTHYLDISGETPWMHSLINRHHARAQQEGTVILPAAGFDSVPSDLGVWLLHQLGGPLEEVDVAYSLRGGLNGGTIASALNMAKQGDHRLMRRRDLLCPEGHTLAEQPRDPREVRWDPERGKWLIPFFMGPVNTRIVRRTASLIKGGYGEHFRYLEWSPLRGALRAKIALGTLGLFEMGLRSRLGRNMIRVLTPRPGKGPSERAIEEGRMKAHFINRNAQGVVSALTLKAQGDPGNAITTQCVCEAAFALVAGEGTGEGGVLTPVTALGVDLWNRLQRVGWNLTSDYGELTE